MRLRDLLLVSALSGSALGADVCSPPPLPTFSPAQLALYNPGLVITGADPVLDTSGRVVVPCTPQYNERTLVLIVAGQSLSVNEVPTPYATTQARSHQLNVWDGKCYQTKDPLLGVNVSGGSVTDQRGTWMSRLADKLIADGHADRVVLVPIAVGATTVAQWADGANAPYLRNLIVVSGRRLQAAGLACSAVLWGQGESDVAASTSQASYAASLASVVSAFNGAMLKCPFFVSRETVYPTGSATGVLAAQLAAPNGTTIFTGENVDSIGSTYRFDGVHLNEAGAAQRAALVEAMLVSALGL